MKLRSLLLMITCLGFTWLNAQTVIWTEDFGNGTTGLASAYSGINGAWTVASTGANGADANIWYVSGQECGNNAGVCGSVCAADASLHLGPAALFGGDVGAAYAAGGLGFFFIETDKRAESPTINLTGQTNITLNFNYLEDIAGQAGYDPGDDATLWYFDGIVWAQIDPLAVTAAGCGIQGTWTAFSVLLPASANNNPNVQIGFRWFNNDDNVGTDPSFAVDDITLTIPAVACDATITQAGPFCADAPSLNLTAAQGGGTWTGNGITNGVLGTFDPATAGVGNQVITYTLGCGDVDTMTILVNALPTITANASPATTVCNGDMVTLTGGGGTSYTWTGGVTDGVAFPAGATTNYIVTGTDANGCIDTSSVTIIVNNCSQPTASFIPDSLTICAGGDILFTDNSTGAGITNWTWTFPGGAPPTANTQGPHNIVFATPGTYNINLSVTDANGNDDTTIVVTVVACSSISAGFTMSNNSICAGDSIIFTDATTGGTPTIWQWDFDLTTGGGVTPSTSILQGPNTVFYNTPGTYTIELIVFDGTSFDTTSNTITVTDCSPTANFSASNTTLCEADCITFTDLSTGTPTSYSWSFPGGTPATAIGANPGSICYPTSGNYDVTLTVTNQYGTDVITMNGLITVNICTAPTAGITMNDVDGEICDNSCIDFTYDPLTGGTPTTLTWTFPGGTPSSFNSTDPNETITVCWNDTSGTFSVGVAVSNANGNSNANINVIVHLEPIVNAGLDTSITIGANGYLNAVVTDTAGNSVSGGTFGWTPVGNLTNPAGQSTTVIQPLVTTTYTVTYTDQYGCVVTDDVVITVDIALNIGVPSAFSPNGDGSNDFLLLRGKVVIQTMNFTIYNRYGQKVFETQDIDVGWDGTHNGNELNPGVFVYYVNVTFIDGSAGQLKGNVTLVR